MAGAGNNKLESRPEETSKTRKPRLAIVGPRIRALPGDPKFTDMADALAQTGFEAWHEQISGMDDFVSLLDRRAPDLVFCSFFKVPRESSEVGYLEDAAIERGIGWIGSQAKVLELALSKPMMKRHWRQHGIATPDWFTLRPTRGGDLEGEGELQYARSFPYIVKPANEGNSRGIDDSSVVRNTEELRRKVSAVAERYGEVLVESFVAGAHDSREFTAAMIGGGPESIVAAVEIRKGSSKALVISNDLKKNGRTELAPIADPQLRERVESMARLVFATSGAKDYARCDILLHEGRLYAIEMNGQPMVPDPWFERCANTVGLDRRQYLLAIVLAGLVENSRSGHALIPIPPAMKDAIPPAVFERLTRQRNHGTPHHWHG